MGICAILLSGYLLGSIPVGYLVARAKGVDIRKAGSGNIGATNVFRVLGRPAGTGVLVADVLKGWLACWLGQWVGVRFEPAGSVDLFPVLGGFSAIIGHNYTIWLRFKGGKGIATSAGVLLGLMPLALLGVLGTFFLVLGLSRYVSLSSMCAALVLPLGAWWSGESRLLLALSLVISLMAIWRHRSNIGRLLSGTESRIGRNKTQRGGET